METPIVGIKNLFLELFQKCLFRVRLGLGKGLRVNFEILTQILKSAGICAGMGTACAGMMQGRAQDCGCLRGWGWDRLAKFAQCGNEDGL